MTRKPADIERAAKKFAEFHDRDPETVQAFRIPRLPKKIPLAGEAEFMSYRSDKWGEKADYWHDHEAGVKCGIVEAKGPYVTLPVSLRETDTLVRLGYCLGFGFIDHNGDLIEAKVRTPYPELFCTPDGRSLIVIESKKTLIAVIWGGHLDVRAAGIVS